MACPEAITRNPCCDTNSQIAGDDTWGVICTHTHTQTLFQVDQGCGQRFKAGALPWFSPSCTAPHWHRAGTPWDMHREETFQERQNLPRSVLNFLPAERLSRKWPGHATLSLHPSATFPRVECCPVTRSINCGFSRYCDTSDQVKQAVE